MIEKANIHGLAWSTVHSAPAPLKTSGSMHKSTPARAGEKKGKETR
jgi:hypothetical protein